MKKSEDNDQQEGAELPAEVRQAFELFGVDISECKYIGLADQMSRFPQATIPILEQFLHSEKPMERLNACYLLSYLGERVPLQETADLLRQAIAERSDFVCMKAYRLAILQGQTGLSQELSECLDFAGGTFFERILETTTKCKVPEYRAILLDWGIRFLENQKGRMLVYPEGNGTDMSRADLANQMIYVINALGDLGDERAFPILQKVYERDGYSRYHSGFADVALSRLGGEAGVQRLIHNLESHTGDSLLNLRLLAEKRSPQVVPALIKLLARPRSMVEDRVSIVKHLGYCNDARALPVLMAYARDHSGEERAIAIEALGNLGDKRAVPELQNYLQDTTEMNMREAGGTFYMFRDLRGKQVKDVAAEALKKLGVS